jgi:DnaJ-class molecular chaperone
MNETKGESQSDNMPCLEVICPDCNGEGGFSDNPPHDFTRCFECDGAGYVPTEAGKKVLALMRHNFGPMASKLHFGLTG